MSKSIKEQLQTGRPHILLVDDDINILFGLQDVLDDEGYEVTVAQTAGEALPHIAQQPFCAAIIDYSLPDSNGLELSKKIRAAASPMQIILMTGHDRVEMGASADGAGLLSAFLRKPVDVDTILRTLSACMQRLCERHGIAFVPVGEQKHRQEAVAMANAKPIAATTATAGAHTSVHRPWITVAIALATFGIGLRVGRLSVSQSVAPTVSAVSAAPTVSPTPPTLAEPPRVQPPEPPAPSPATTAVPPPQPVQPTTPVESASSSHPAERPAITKHTEEVDENDPQVRLKKVRTRLRHNAADPNAIAELRALLDDDARTVRLAAIETASTFKVSDATLLGALIQTTNDEDIPIAHAAITTLGRLGGSAAAAAPTLASLMDPAGEPNESLRGAAADAIRGIGSAAVPILVNLLRDETKRLSAIAALGELGPQAADAVPSLAPLEQDPVAGVAVMQALARIDTDHSGAR